MLKSNTSLTKLNVSFICNNYAINSFLFDSFSTGNQVRDDGAKFIAEVLKTNTTLTDLGLGSDGNGLCFLLFAINSPIAGNEIGDEGAKSIAGALKENTSLTQLILFVMSKNNYFSPHNRLMK